MSETPARQQRDTDCLAEQSRDNTRETLKSLAKKVLNPTVSGVSPLVRETARQAPFIAEHTETPARQQRDSTLAESTFHLQQAGITIAIWDDGTMRVLVTESDTITAIDDGATIYTPVEMHHYIHLEQHERRLLHSFKKMFGGITQWRDRESQ